MVRKPANLDGQKFGMLTVECMTDQRNDYGQWLYKCHCDCGGERLVTAANLKRGSVTCCGCKYNQARKDITGKKFGKLTAIKPVGRRKEKYSSYDWLCKCDCGKEVVVNVNKLNTGNTKSCGCLRTEQVKSLYQDGTAPCKLSESKKPRKNNTSGVTGVWYDSSDRLWTAEIMFKRQKIVVGRYSNKEDAINARKKAEDRIFGEYLDEIKSPE